MKESKNNLTEEVETVENICDKNHQDEGKNEHKCNCDENCNCENECDCEQDCCDDEESCDCCHNNINEEASYYLSLAQRVQAEFDNYRKRNNEAIKEAEQKGMIKTLEKILPIIDSITNAKLQVKNEEFKNAIDTLYNQTLQILASINVTKIQAVGKEFNPHLHNAIFTEEVEGVEPDIVLEEFQEGFELNGKVIRHSVVKVSK